MSRSGLLNEGNREALAIDVAISIPAIRVIRVLQELVELYGKPKAHRMRRAVVPVPSVG